MTDKKYEIKDKVRCPKCKCIVRVAVRNIEIVGISEDQPKEEEG